MQSGQIILSMFKMLQGFFATCLVARNSRCFLDKNTHFFRFSIDQAINHALLNHRIRARPKPCTEENISNIFTATTGAI